MQMWRNNLSIPCLTAQIYYHLSTLKSWVLLPFWNSMVNYITTQKPLILWLGKGISAQQKVANHLMQWTNKFLLQLGEVKVLMNKTTGRIGKQDLECLKTQKKRKRVISIHRTSYWNISLNNTIEIRKGRQWLRIWLSREYLHKI